MPLNYDPIRLLPQGAYDFVITKATEGFTKSKKPNLKLTLNVDDGKGYKGTVYWQTLLEFSGNLRKVCLSVGLLDKYENKTLEEKDLENKTGKCFVSVESSPGYDDKNIIYSFVLKKDESAAESSSVIDDVITF